MRQDTEQPIRLECSTSGAFLSARMPNPAPQPGAVCTIRSRQAAGKRGCATDCATDPLPIGGRNSATTSRHTALYTQEVIIFLRYSEFVPHDAVERWSRKLREINAAQPVQALAILDSLIGDFRAVVHAGRLALQRNSGPASKFSAFETESAQLKAAFDRLGALVLAAEPEDSRAAKSLKFGACAR